jgi:hypothetical protein
MYHIVQPYGDGGNLSQATIVASLGTLREAWEHLDALHSRMSQNNVRLDYVTLVVVDDERRAVQRPIGMVT